MNIYLVERNDKVYYDETAGMVIIAKTDEEAVDFFLEDVNTHDYYSSYETEIVEDQLNVRIIGTTHNTYVYDVPFLVLRDFRAG